METMRLPRPMSSHMRRIASAACCSRRGVSYLVSFRWDVKMAPFMAPALVPVTAEIFTAPDVNILESTSAFITPAS